MELFAKKLHSKSLLQHSYRGRIVTKIKLHLLNIHGSGLRMVTIMHGVVYLDRDLQFLSTKVYNWVPVKKCWM